MVKTAAFERFLEALEAAAPLRAEVEALQADDLDAVTACSRALRARLEQAPLPPDVEAEIIAAYAALCPGEASAPVAVRSSATTEDAEDASFAGLQDTYLWVMGAAEAVRMVRSCWASLYSVESMTYRKRHAMPEAGVAMAVVVQRMVDARTAGVMFTRSPMTGDRSVITLEGAWGLGSAVVSGEVTPDRWVVAKITGEITVRDIADKHIQQLPAPGGGIHDVETPEDMRRQACLSDAELLALQGHRPQGRAPLRAAAGHRVGGGPRLGPDPAAAEPPGDRVVDQGGRAGGQARGQSSQSCDERLWRRVARRRRAGEDRAMSLTAKDVAEIMRLLEQSSFDSLDLEVGDLKLSLRRGEGDAPSTASRSPSPASRGRTKAADPGPPPPAGEVARRAGGGQQLPAADGLTDVPSPLLGVFYRAPKPGEAPFVDVGARVEPDTVIAIIEVMKLMNSVRAGVAGEVVEIPAQNGALVEYGETLVRVRASE